MWSRFRDVRARGAVPARMTSVTAMPVRINPPSKSTVRPKVASTTSISTPPSLDLDVHDLLDCEGPDERHQRSDEEREASTGCMQQRRDVARVDERDDDDEAYRQPRQDPACH